MATKRQGTTKKGRPAIDEKGFADLAEKIAAVLTHPACPQYIYDGLVDGLNECVSRTEINHHPGYIAAILIEHAKDRVEKKGGAR